MPCPGSGSPASPTCARASGSSSRCAGEVTDDVLDQVRQMAETLLSNPVIENFEVRVEQTA